MCRLFGLIANKEVDVEFSFLKAEKPFRSLSNSNPDGWGVGYYVNEHPNIFKEPISALQSSEFPTKSKEIKSKIFVSHVRFSTQGQNTKNNTHPFKYQNWVFAHNGNIDIKIKLKEQLNSKYSNKVVGETDSEVFFYWILQNIDSTKTVVDRIKEAILFIDENRGSRTSSLNFILTNGKDLFAFRKAFSNIDYYSLYYLNRDPEKTDTSNFQSQETKLLINSKLLKEEKAFLICSEKLTGEEWTPLKNNELLIVDSQLKISNITFNVQ